MSCTQRPQSPRMAVLKSLWPKRVGPRESGDSLSALPAMKRQKSPWPAASVQAVRNHTGDRKKALPNPTMMPKETAEVTGKKLRGQKHVLLHRGLGTKGRTVLGGDGQR